MRGVLDGVAALMGRHSNCCQGSLSVNVLGKTDRFCSWIIMIRKTSRDGPHLYICDPCRS